MLKFLIISLLLSLAWASVALAESDPRYVPGLPAFHQPFELWKIRHGQNLLPPRRRFGGAPLTKARLACRSCHQPETCLDCHQGQGGPDLGQILPEKSSISLLIPNGLDEIPGGQWSDCLRCHPLEAAWPGGLDLIEEPGEYLPVHNTFSCPAVQLLGRQMSLMNLSLKRAEYLVDLEWLKPFQAEADRLESLLSSPLVLTRAENIALGMQNLERLAESELSRPALAAGERHYLLILAGPFLGFGLVLAWRAGSSAKNKTIKNARMYTGLSFTFLSLSLGIGAGLLFGPDDFFYPALADIPVSNKPVEETGAAFKDKDLDRLFLLTELIESWRKTQPRHDAPIRALSLAYQDIKQELLFESPDYLQGPPWPGALAAWALVAESAAEIKYGPSPTDDGLNPGVEVWDDQINWLFSLPDSPLKKMAALIMVKALAQARPWPSETRDPLFLAAPAEEPGIINFGSAARQSSGQLLLNRLLSLLSEPDELSAGLLAVGQGLAKAGFQAEAARVFGRVYETALYIKDQQSKVSVFLALYRAWSDLDNNAGLKVLAETLALAAATDSETENFNHWSAGRSLAKVARLWSRSDLLEALTMANDLSGDHEAWLTSRAAVFMALGTDLEASALNQQQALNLKPAYQDYALYLRSFDLKSPRYSSALLPQDDPENGHRLLDKAGLGEERQSNLEKPELLARSGKLALQAKELWKNGHSEDARAVWMEAWELTQVVGDSCRLNLDAARLYQALGDSVADEQPHWAGLAYQKAIRLATAPAGPKPQQ